MYNKLWLLHEGGSKSTSVSLCVKKYKLRHARKIIIVSADELDLKTSENMTAIYAHTSDGAKKKKYSERRLCLFICVAYAHQNVSITMLIIKCSHFPNQRQISSNNLILWIEVGKENDTIKP